MRESLPILRQTDLRKGLLLEYFTVGWNVIEALVGLVAGTMAGSGALVGFALDSLVEASSGSILIWRASNRAEWEAQRRGGRAASDSIGGARLPCVGWLRRGTSHL